MPPRGCDAHLGKASESATARYKSTMAKVYSEPDDLQCELEGSSIPAYVLDRVELRCNTRNCGGDQSEVLGALLVQLILVIIRCVKSWTYQADEEGTETEGGIDHDQLGASDLVGLVC